MSQAVPGISRRLTQVDFGKSEVMESKSQQAKARVTNEILQVEDRHWDFHQAVILQGVFYGTEKRFCDCGECPCPVLELWMMLRGWKPSYQSLCQINAPTQD